MSETSTTPYGGFDHVLVVDERRTGKSREDKDPYAGETLVGIPLADSHGLDESYRAADGARRDQASTLPQGRCAGTTRVDDLGTNDVAVGGRRVLDDLTTEHWVSVRPERRVYPL